MPEEMKDKTSIIKLKQLERRTQLDRGGKITIYKL